jgi:hypothetical protein
LENFNTTPADERKKKEENKQESIIKKIEVEIKDDQKQFSQNDKVKIHYKITPTKNIEAGIVMDLYNIDDNYYLYCFSSPKKKMLAGKVTAFNVEFDISRFNNMNVIVHSSIYDDKNNMLLFVDDSFSPKFIIRRTDYKEGKIQAGVIYKNGENAKWL